jgi:hypothetical protein
MALWTCGNANTIAGFRHCGERHYDVTREFRSGPACRPIHGASWLHSPMTTGNLPRRLISCQPQLGGPDTQTTTSLSRPTSDWICTFGRRPRCDLAVGRPQPCQFYQRSRPWRLPFPVAIARLCRDLHLCATRTTLGPWR